MSKVKIRQIFVIFVAAYFLLAGFLYFLLGEQLHYKDTIHPITMPSADTATQEIVDNNSVSQEFVNDIDRWETISLLFTKFYHNGKGRVNIAIMDGEMALYRTYKDIEDIPEQEPVTITFARPLSARGKKLTLIVSSDAKSGEGVALMLNKSDKNNLTIIHDSEKVTLGRICFSTNGQDEIILAEYYWFIVLGLGLLLILILFYAYRRYVNHRYSFIVSSIYNVYHYKFLISQLVSRDFKSKYKRSILGVFWSFLNPLLTMVVQFLVFSTFFRADTQNYPVYLLSGVICFNYFKETTDMCLVSLTGNANLINKVYVPKYIFPMAKALSCSINLGMSLIPLLAVSLLMGVRLTRSIFLVFYFLLCLIVFTLGVGMVLGTLMVFFRDIQFLWGVISQVWMYATPIFYPAEIIPEKFRFIVRLNPLYHFIGNLRKCLIDGISPEPISYIYCFVFAIGAFLFGSYVFKKNQDKFTLYL